MRKLSVIMILVVLVVTLMATFSFANQDVKIMIDGQELRIPTGEPKAYIDKDNRTVIPIKFIAVALGIEVDWNGKQQLVTFTDADTTVKLKIGERQATVNGKTVYFDTQAVITQARTFVPLKFVSESFGAKVDWIANTKTVVITTAGEPVAEEKTVELVRVDGKVEKLEEIISSQNELGIKRIELLHDKYLTVFCDRELNAGLYINKKRISPVGNASTGKEYWFENNEYIFQFNAEGVDFNDVEYLMFRFDEDWNTTIYTIENTLK